MPPHDHKDKPGTSNAALIKRLLSLGWRYRLGYCVVLFQQMLLVGLNLVGLGLTGLGIDFIRHQLDPSAAAPRWLFGLATPSSWEPMAVAIIR